MASDPTPVQQAETLKAMAASLRANYEVFGRNQHTHARIDALEAGAAALANQLSPDDHLDIYAPGEWKCPQCQFCLSKMTLSASTGDVGVAAQDVFHGEPCPNDGTPMVKVTWRERAAGNYEAYVKLVDDVIQAAQAEHLPGALAKIAALCQPR